MKFNIHKKVNLLFMAIILASGSLLGAYFVRSEAKTLSAELDERAHVLLNSLSADCEYPILIKDKDSLSRLVNAALGQKDVISCRISDRKGNVLMEAGAASPPRSKTYGASVYSKKVAAGLGDALLLETSKPRKEETEEIGKIKLTLSLANMDQKLDLVRDALVAVILLTLLLASLASSLLLKLILSRPIDALVEGTRQIAKGNLDYQVSASTRDEIGLLAQSFNKMTQDLQSVTVSKYEIEKSLSILRATLESTTDGILVVGQEGRIDTFNQRLAEIWRIPDAVLAQKSERPLIEFMLQQVKDPQEYLKRIQDLNALPNAESYDLIDFLDGRHVERYSTPQRLAGKSVGRVWSFRDISERKRVDEERQKLGVQLVQSEKMAAVGQLAGGVAHEINNPLGVILGFAQSVNRRLKPDDVFWVPLQSIEREAKRCKNLVQELLTFSRVGKTEKELCELNEVILSSLSLIEAETKVQAVELVRNLAEGLPPIRINQNQIQQVLVNLCNNAIDAMPQGGTLTVESATAQVDGKEGVEIRIRDTGTGIPKNIRGRIFEPFFTTKEVGKGTGLGLSLVYEIVLKHQGSIEVESEEGRGTVFKVRLPLA